MLTPAQLRTRWIEARNTTRVLRRVRDIAPVAHTHPAALLRRWAEQTPDALAIAHDDERFTWKDFNDQANRWAAFFHGQGVGARDVVAIVMDNRPDFLFALMGLNKLGAIGALINHNLKNKELVHALAVAHPRNVLAGREHRADVEAIIGEVEGLSGRDALWTQDGPGADEASPDAIDAEVAAQPPTEMAGRYRPSNKDTFCYIYTSGTTGLPKAAIITNQRQMAAGVVFGETMIESGAGEITYVTLPLYHSSAMFIGFGAALAMGGAVALRRKFSASAFWPDVRRYDATAILYIGELCRYLLHTPESPDERSHRVKVAVGNGLRPDIWTKFQERFAVPVVREFYGATEGNAPLLNWEGRPGMLGRIRKGQVLVRCDAATGELIRNAHDFCEQIGPGEQGLLLGKISPVMKFDGYVDKKATDSKIVHDIFEKGDRYFNSGDLLELHEDGWLSFVDRIGDTFRWKGENVSTNEVAEALNGADGVLEANVYGVLVPDTEGRAGMAALRTEEGFDLDAFARFVTGNLPKYQRPYFLRLLGTGMRTTATFKHQKVDYRDEAYDPAKVSDPLYFLDGERYVELDAALYARIQKGELQPA